MVNLSGPERPQKKNHQQSGKLRIAEKLTGEDKSEPGGEQMDEEAERDGKKKSGDGMRWGGGGIPEGPR